MLRIIYDARKNKFTAVEGSKIFREDYVFGDKWNCYARYDGSVKCMACETINGRYFEICLKISPKGLVTITKMKGGTRNVVKCFKVRNWPNVGIITLSSGPVENRNAYYN